MVQIERKFLHKKNNTEGVLKEQNNILKVYSISMTLLCCILVLLFIINNNNLVYQNQDLTKKYESEYENLLIKYNNLKDNYSYLEKNYESVSASMKELAIISNELEDQNHKLVSSNQQYYEQLCSFGDREELFNKYEYAIIDDTGKRTDITYEQLKRLEELVANSKIKNEDLILAWIMTESEGQEKIKNPNSTAKGYGQILNSTSEWIHRTLIDSDINWHPDIALDGDANLEMMVAYIDYLYEENNGNL
jgi:predicted RNase H-like nuclease (RuvC/YqgF family)